VEKVERYGPWIVSVLALIVSVVALVHGGPKGDRGATGATGATGARGANGARGQPGAQGQAANLTGDENDLQTAYDTAFYLCQALTPESRAQADAAIQKLNAEAKPVVIKPPKGSTLPPIPIPILRHTRGLCKP
jgi:hypothetical protein